MKNMKILFQSIVILLVISCSGSGGDDEPNPNPPPVQVDPPSATTLIFPDNNSECNEGTILSDEESAVLFRWNASDNTDTYQVNLKDLKTSSTRTFTSSTNQLEITILRANPYAWSVTSSANNTSQTAQSAEWKFYNAGLPAENFAPFPADLVSPEMGSSVNAASGTIELRWIGSDIDDDIQSYEILFGTENPPGTLESTTTSPVLDVQVNINEVYYWRVISIDSQGNTSNSEVFQFRTN